MVVAESNGKMISAHCNFMAGLGESCSHVASILWAVESGVRLRESMTVTQKKAYWVIPGVVKDVPYALHFCIFLFPPMMKWTVFLVHYLQSLLSLLFLPWYLPIPINMFQNPLTLISLWF